jgi:hypothetical protein
MHTPEHELFKLGSQAMDSFLTAYMEKYTNKHMNALLFFMLLFLGFFAVHAQGK